MGHSEHSILTSVTISIDTGTTISIQSITLTFIQHTYNFITKLPWEAQKYMNQRENYLDHTDANILNI